MNLVVVPPVLAAEASWSLTSHLHYGEREAVASKKLKFSLWFSTSQSSTGGEDHSARAVPVAGLRSRFVHDLVRRNLS